MLHVFGLTGEQFEVLEPVVRPVAVLVVDALRWGEPSPQVLLHDVAVLHDRSPGVTIPVEASNVATGRDGRREESLALPPGDSIQCDQSAIV